MATYDTTIPNFVWHLNGLVPADGVRGDRGALAAMRRNLGKAPGAVSEASAQIDRFLAVDADGKIAPWDDWSEQVLYALGGLFALTVKEPFPERADDDADDGRQSWRHTAGLRLPDGNFGQSMRQLAEELVKESGDKDSRQRVDRRFISLLDADGEQVFEHLRYNATLLGSKGVEVNWVRLGRDLLYWNNEDRSIQRQWARAYWRTDASNRGAPVAAGAEASESE